MGECRREGNAKALMNCYIFSYLAFDVLKHLCVTNIMSCSTEYVPEFDIGWFDQ